MRPVQMSAVDLGALRRQHRQQFADERRSAAPKYRNTILEVEGVRFDSRAEYRRWCHLQMLERGGDIRDLQRQVSFELIPAQVRPGGGKIRPTTYVADFVYVDRLGHRIVEDVKGAMTEAYRLKRKLMLWRHGIEILEVRA